MVFQRTPTVSNSSVIKSRNLSAVLMMLLRYGSLSRVGLSQLTGLSTTTITNLISELIERGVVIQDGEQQSSRQRGVGRPQMSLRLVAESHYAIGVHFGVGRVNVAICDLLAKPVLVRSIEHPMEQPAETVLDQTHDLVGTLVKESGIEQHQIVGLGVGASGLVDPTTGVNVIAPNLNWRDVPIRDRFRTAVPYPVTVDNNVRAMALGEALFGAGQDVYSLAFVYARIGVGAGLVVGGQLYYGGGAGAGEIGHTTILPHGGANCRCGNSGCLESLVSEPVIIALAEEIARQDPGGQLAAHLAAPEGRMIDRVFAAARAGDEATRVMLEARAYYMGIALANLVNILNPELIIMGGVFAWGKDLLLPIVQDTMRQRAFARLGDKVQLVTPSFEDNAGVIGAAALALNEFFYQPTEGNA